VVLENNGPLRMPWLNQVGAVLEAWYPGARGGEAIARLLFGEVAPSGRLPMTWPHNEAQLPRPQIPGAGLASIGLMPQGQPADTVDYRIEGADVGYRWFQRRNIEPLFAFGYGLTYTHFGYDKLQARWNDGQLVVGFDVSNRGKRDGIDVPQLYVTLPDTGQMRRLAGWSRIVLKAGEMRHVEIIADSRILANYDSTQHAWLRPAGRYHVQLGHSAASFEGDGSIDLPARECASSDCRTLP
jgi:beta-glucosidase